MGNVRGDFGFRIFYFGFYIIPKLSESEIEHPN